MRHLRSPIAWHGGKGHLLKELLPLIPYGSKYVELFGGGANVILNRRPYGEEVYGDIDPLLCNFFSVLRDPKLWFELEHMVRWTLYSRSEFVLAIDLLHTTANPLLKAWSFYVTQNMGFSGVTGTPGRWGRAFVSRQGMSMINSKWIGRQSQFSEWHERLKNVTVANMSWSELLTISDESDTVFYVDPPYAFETRVTNKVYRHEFQDEQHSELVKSLLTIKGGAVLSCYFSPIYQPLIDAGWTRYDFRSLASGANKGRHTSLRGAGGLTKHVQRVETVLRSPGCERFDYATVL